MVIPSTIYAKEDPRSQTREIKERLNDISKQARETLKSVNDVRAKVLLKTTADLISGLTSVYEDYESKRETSPEFGEAPLKTPDTDMFF